MTHGPGLDRRSPRGSMTHGLLLATTLALAGGCKQTEPPHEPPAVARDAVARGAYLARAGGCLVCHTAIGPRGPDLANAGAGGLEMKVKLGMWRAPNITPDPRTGIGSWTDDQIIAAVREGRRPDGTKLTPIMPYPSYHVLTDDDARAVVA